jgi:hypothetical protein
LSSCSRATAASRVADELALGDLEHQAAGGDAGVGDRGQEVGGQARIEQLGGRQVHRHEQGGLAEPGAQGRERVAGVHDHLPAERHDQPGLLGHRDERVGPDDPALRVRPAGERLDPARPAGHQVHDRLIVELDLVALDRELEVLLEAQALNRAREHGRVEPAVAAFALALGRVHREVGGPHQRVGVVRRPAGDRDPDAGPHVELGAVHRDRAREHEQDPLGDPRGRRRLGMLGEQDGELVAADARDRVGRAQDGADAAADLGEHIVSAVMAQAVVDDLEVVDVDVQESGRRGAGARERLRDAVE